MARKKLTHKRIHQPDRQYGHVLIGRLINKVMIGGKKTVAEKIVYDALQIAAKQIGKDPVVVFETAFSNITPAVQLRARRVGGANLQIPTEVSNERRTVLALLWLVAAARAHKGKDMCERLGQELTQAYNNAGDAVRKKDETHRMAEANRAFAHFARF